VEGGDELPEGVPREGEIFAEKYRIERVLGIGGMGIVLAATHIHLDERVAIKLLLPLVAKNPDLVARFLREGRAAIKIRSEHVGRVLDVGKPAVGSPYLVMEYLEGTDLSAVLKTQGPLPIVTAVDYLLQACEALAEAHAMGTIHRDLKPANLFVATLADGGTCIKVLDFGISKVADGTSADLSMTKSTTLMGSPLYMSPEQLRSLRSVDARTDIWALGVILFEMLAGAPPFAGASLPDLSVSIIVGTAPLLRAMRPDAPAKLEAAIARCLEKDPIKRIAGIGELATLLAPFGSSEAEASRENIFKALARPSVSLLAGANAATQSGAHAMVHAATEVAGTEVSWTDPGKTQSRRPPYVAFVVGGLVALAVAGSIAVVRRGGTGKDPSLGTAPVGPSTTASTAHETVTPIATPLATLVPTPTRGSPSSTTVAKPAVPLRAASAKPVAPAEVAPVVHPPAPPPPVVPIAPPPSAAPTGVTHDRHG
jgi:serine/threonine protein kinase